MSRLLVVRADKLGDVLLALPALLQLRKALPNSEIDFCCQAGPLSVVQPTLESNRIGAVSLESVKIEKYNGVLLFDGHPALMRRAWLKRVPVRISLYSKFWSLVCLTDGIRQRRSYSAKNEALYNWDLAERFATKFGVALGKPTGDLVLTGDDVTATKAKSVLEALKVDWKKPFCVLHPGMGGSALNLSADHYAGIVERIRPNWPLVLSIGPSENDQALKTALLKRFPDVITIEGEPLTVMREVFRLADTVFAPSTGPLHLAHLAGAKTVGFYPPVQSQREERWAPFGGKAKVTTLAPEVRCPGKRDCIGSSCPEYLCMERWNWASHLPL